MSRSNPNAGSPNPATRFFAWNGEKGVPQYYNHEIKEEVELACDMSFLYLDDLATVRGWHEPSKSGIWCNEVRDTRTEAMVVKCKAGILASGFYSQIKDVVKAAGGRFTTRVYLAFKNGNAVEIGCFEFKGAALNAWVEFRKKHRKEIQEKAVRIKGFTEGKKGKVVFRVPVFSIQEVSAETNAKAVALDKEFQAWLADYFASRKSDAAPQAQPEPQSSYEPEPEAEPEYPDPEPPGPPEDDDVPF